MHRDSKRRHVLDKLDKLKLLEVLNESYPESLDNEGNRPYYESQIDFSRMNEARKNLEDSYIDRGGGRAPASGFVPSHESVKGDDPYSKLRDIMSRSAGARDRYNKAIEKTMQRMPFEGTKRAFEKMAPPKVEEYIDMPTLDITGEIPDPKKESREPTLPVIFEDDQIKEKKPHTVEPFDEMIKKWAETKAKAKNTFDRVEVEMNTWMSPGRDWGGSIGAGMAALGDAFMAGGGMKGNFLNNIIKTREKRREEPLKRFQAFQKMIQTEINARNAQEYRMGNLNIQGQKIAATAEDREKKGKQKTLEFEETKKERKEDQEYRLRETTAGNERVQQEWKAVISPGAEQLYRPAFVKWANADAERWKVTTGEMINANRILWAKPKAAGSKIRVTDRKSQAAFNNDWSRAIISDMSKKTLNLDDMSTEELGSKTFLPRFREVEKMTQMVHQKSGKGKISNAMNRVSLVLPKFWLTLLNANGIVGGSHANIVSDIQDNKTYFVPKDSNGRLDHSRRIALDIPGVHGFSGDSWQFLPDVVASLRNTLGIDDPAAGMATIIQSLFTQVHSPLKNLDFGASQSAIELRDYRDQSGAAAAKGTETAKLNYILGVTARFKGYLKERNQSYLTLPGGKAFMKMHNILTTEDFDKPIYANPLQVGKMASRATTKIANKYDIKPGQAWNRAQITELPHWYKNYMRKTMTIMGYDKETKSFKKGTKGLVYWNARSKEFTDSVVDTPDQSVLRTPDRWHVNIWNKYLKEHGLNER